MRVRCAVLGEAVQHRTSRSLTTLIEQDHRSITQRSSPMRGFTTIRSAARFWSAHAEQRQSFRTRRTTGERVSLVEQRTGCQERWGELLDAVQVA